jgi:hypothetical protein
MSLIPEATRRHSCRVLGRDHRVTYNGQPVAAIFRSSYVDASGTESTGPNLTMPTSDVVAMEVRKDVVFEVDGKPYRVLRHELGGTGMSRVLLV